MENSVENTTRRLSKFIQNIFSIFSSWRTNFLVKLKLRLFEKARKTVLIMKFQDQQLSFS